jgi:hypothetical protein
MEDINVEEKRTIVAVEEGFEVQDSISKDKFSSGILKINEIDLIRSGIVCSWNIVVF